DLGAPFRGEYHALIAGKVPIAGAELIQPAALVARLVFITTVGCVVHIQAGHLVESHYAVDGITEQVRLYPAGKFLVATVVRQRLDRHQANIETRRSLPFPAQGVDPNGVAALLAYPGDPQEVALQSAEGEVFVKQKGQLHRGFSFWAAASQLKGSCRPWQRV